MKVQIWLAWKPSATKFKVWGDTSQLEMIMNGEWNIYSVLVLQYCHLEINLYYCNVLCEFLCHGLGTNNVLFLNSVMDVFITYAILDTQSKFKLMYFAFIRSLNVIFARIEKFLDRFKFFTPNFLNGINF